MRVSARLAPPPLSKVASAFSRILHRNLPRNIDVLSVAWTPRPSPVCHALVMPRIPPPIEPEPDNAQIGWAVRLRRHHVLTAWAFSSALEDFGEPLGHEGEKFEGASVSVMEVKSFGPLGRIHLLESDETQAGLLARHIEAGRVPPTVQPLVGPLPLTSLCCTLYSAARTVNVHFAPTTFGLRTPLQPSLSVPEPLIWVGNSDPGKHLFATKAYPPLRRLTSAQRKELEGKLLGNDEGILRLCAALISEGRDAMQTIRDEHIENEQNMFIKAAVAAKQEVEEEEEENTPLDIKAFIHPTGVGASRARRKPK